MAQGRLRCLTAAPSAILADVTDIDIAFLKIELKSTYISSNKIMI